MIDHYYESVPGWFSWEEIYKWVAQEAPAGSTVVEVGCWLGKSLCYLLVELANRNRDVLVCGVDHFKGSEEDEMVRWMKKYATNYSIYEQCLTNCLRAGHRYFDMVPKPSLDAASMFANNSIWYLFLDASHDYKSVHKDLVAWIPKIAKGGRIGGHDYNETWPGVKKAVKELLPHAVERLDSCWEAQL